MMSDFQDEMAAQNDYLRSQLTALTKGGRERMKRFVQHEIRCQRCGDPVVQIVETVPYRVIRYRTISDGPTSGARLQKWLDGGDYEPGPTQVRLDPRWKFFPIADDEHGDPRLMIPAACSCAQFRFTLQNILSRGGSHSTAKPTRDDA